jgi:uncharacterized repeat protein (TIGR01451 family)
LQPLLALPPPHPHFRTAWNWPATSLWNANKNGADGSVATILEAPKLVVPGDQLVFVVRYKNVGAQPASNFTVTNPIPRAVAFSGTSGWHRNCFGRRRQNWGFVAA